MSYVDNLKTFLKDVESEASKICEGEAAFARIQVLDNDLCLEIHDPELHVFHTIVFETDDNFEDRKQLLNEVVDWIHKSRKIAINEKAENTE